MKPRAPRWRRFLRWTLINLAVSVLLAELVVRLVVSEQAFATVANVYRKSPVAEIGYTLRPGFHGRAFGVDLDVNPAGFRGPPWILAKSPGTFRIALVGDSHAFGFGVPFDQTVGQVLAKRLSTPQRPVETLTFAASGYNASQEEALLSHLVWPFQPDLVIVLSTTNDHEPPLLADDEGYLHFGGPADDPYTIVRDESLDRVLTKPGWLVRHSRLVLLARIVAERRRLAAAAAQQQHAKVVDNGNSDWMGPITDGPIPDNLRLNVLAPLRRTIRDARAHGVPVVIATHASNPEYRRLYQLLAREEHVPVLEMMLLFPEVRSWQELIDQFGLVWDSHLNAAGHRRWAEGIDRFLREQKLF